MKFITKTFVIGGMYVPGGCIVEREQTTDNVTGEVTTIGWRVANDVEGIVSMRAGTMLPASWQPHPCNAICVDQESYTWMRKRGHGHQSGEGVGGTPIQVSSGADIVTRP